MYDWVRRFKKRPLPRRKCHGVAQTLDIQHGDSDFEGNYDVVEHDTNALNDTENVETVEHDVDNEDGQPILRGGAQPLHEEEEESEDELLLTT